MLDIKEIGCRMEIPKDIIEIFKNSNRIEVFLDNIPSTRMLPANQQSYVCSRINLLVDHTQMFNLCVKEFDSETVIKEIFTIALEKGWRKVKVMKGKRTREIEEGIILKVQDYDLNQLISFQSFDSDGILELIKIVSNEGKIIGKNNNLIASLIEDVGILIADSNQTLYVGCDEMPYQLIITKDKKLIFQLTDGKKLHCLTDNYPL